MLSANKVKTIRDAQHYLKDLYPNEDRDIDYIYGYLSRNTGYLCKNIWQETVKVASFMKSVSWLMAFCSKTEIDLEEAFIRRYPGVCPYCIVSPCLCRKTKKSPSRFIPAYKVEEELFFKANSIINSATAIDFDFVCRQSDVIYPNNQIIWEYGGPWRHLVKIQEEIAEVHEAMSGVINKTRPKAFLGEEVADSFAWIMSAYFIVFEQLSFLDEFKSYYRKGCPVCFANPCECNKRAERAAEFIDPRTFAELRDKIQALYSELGLKDSEIEGLKASLTAAEKAQSEPIARGAIAQAREGMRKIGEHVEFAEKNTKKVESIVNSIGKILAALPF